MAQSRPAATPFTADPAGRAPGRRPARLAAAGADRGRAAGARRADAERARAGRVGAGEREHGPRRLRAARGARACSSPATGAAASSPSGAGGSPEVERIAAEAIEAAREAGVDPRDVAIVTLVSAALPEALDAGLPDGARTTAPPPELDLDAARRRARARRLLARGRRVARRAARAPPADRPARGRARGVPARPAAARARRAWPRRAADRRAPTSSRRPATRCSPGSPRRGTSARAAVAPRAARPRGPRRDGRRPRRAPLGGRLGGRHRRGGMLDLGGRSPDGPARRADELVAGPGLGRMPVSRGTS